MSWMSAYPWRGLSARLRRMKLSKAARCSAAGLGEREAVQQAGAAGADQVLLAAPARRMRGVPRRVAAAGPIEVSQLGRSRAARVARPVLARVIVAVGIR